MGTTRHRELINLIKSRLRTLIPDDTPYVEEKRAEVLAYAAEETFGRPGVRDVAAAAGIPLADLEKLWRRVDSIVDAH